MPRRGGSPYLPRGLKPVGAGIASVEYTTEGYHNAPQMPLANIDNGQFFGQTIPINRINPSPHNAYLQQQMQQQQQQQQSHPRGQLSLQLPSPQTNVASMASQEMRTTTQQPQIERSPLDEIFNQDYDVDINDAINPKPLSHSHESNIGHGFTLNKYDNEHDPFARSDVAQSSSQYRTTALPSSQSRQGQASQHHPQQQSRHQPQSQSQIQKQPQQSQQSQYYDDEYDY